VDASLACGHIGHGLIIIIVECCALTVLLCQLAADILAATLLRDKGARSAFLIGGHFSSLLKLLCTENQRVQLSAVAVFAKMAETSTPSAHLSPSTMTMSSQDPQLLLQVRSKLQDLLLQVLRQSANGTASRDATAHHAAGVSAGSRAQQTPVLQPSDCESDASSCMMLEYGALALWAVTAVSAHFLKPVEVFEQLASAGQLTSMLMQLPQPSSAALCSCAGMLNALVAKCSVTDCASDAPSLAQQLQPTLAALRALLLYKREADLEVRACRRKAWARTSCLPGPPA